jgi:succinyl-diaminopimelate desuccinylase
MISDLVGEGATVEFVDHAPAGASASESPFCAGLIQSAGGQRRAKQAWTDVGRFSQWGLPAVSFGPGLPEKAHQQDEYASLDLLCEYWRILQRWCRQPTPGRA